MILTILYFITGVIAPVYAQVSYSYDQNGNVTSDGNNCFTYNEANQLTQVTKCSNNQIIAQYVYDYQGNRIEKKIYSNGTLQKTVYSPNDGYETVKLASNGATLNTTYYQVNDEQVAKKNPDGTKNYYLTDNLGSTNVLTNQTGAVIETTKYYPYGQVRAGGTSSKFLYTGQENDPETGLDYYNSRYYDAHLQRFIQPDSVLPNVYDPQQLNRYSYVRNNPVTYNDPSGHYAVLIIGLILAYLGVSAIIPATHHQTPAQTGQNVAAALNSLQSLNQAVHNAELSTYKSITSYVSKTVSSALPPSNNNNKNNSNNNSKGNSNGGSQKPPAKINPHDWVREFGKDPNNQPEGWKKIQYGPKSNDFNYYNPETKESLHPDIDNPAHEPHWDYTMRGMKDKIRIGLDGKEVE